MVRVSVGRERAGPCWSVCGCGGGGCVGDEESVCPAGWLPVWNVFKGAKRLGGWTRGA